ncbi:MAG: glycosyltransferase family 39 protein [Clostridia bacterium]|nr:glycosyltransferase family 39 protein [Clostridia bacterium]
MLSTVISLYAFLILFLIAYYFVLAKEDARLPVQKNKYGFVFPCLLALTVRLVFAAITHGYETDLNCWRYWAMRLSETGPWGFYADTYFCDYPPGYLYILGLMGYFIKLFPSMGTVFLKLPAILFDVFLCALIYKKASENTSLRHALTLSGLYALCPAIIINSAVWGQVDAVFTFFLVLFLWALSEEKYRKGAALFAVAVVIKPQALLLSPLILLLLWEKRKTKGILKLFLSSFLTFIGIFILLVLPFTITKSPFYIFTLYKNTLASYPFASLNAFNLFTLLGANGVSVSDTFCGVSYTLIGTLGIILSVLFAGYIFIKGRDKSRFFYAAALIISGVFTFGVKMHERYLFPAIAFLFFAYILKRDKRIMVLSCALSLLHFINVIYIYTLSLSGIYYASAPDSLASLISFLHIVTFGFMAYLGISLYIGLPKPEFCTEEKTARITKKDRVILLTVTLLYGVLAYVNLGNTTAPTSFAPNVSVADFGEKVHITSASVYKGIGETKLYFSFSNDGENWSAPLSYDGSPCFKWENYAFTVDARFAKVQIAGKTDSVYEAAFWNGDSLLPLSSESTLFDEQHLAEKENTYQNSTYFDEIYHARTAYEHINYIPHYETTHPPLGKHIIGLGIRLFGMNPFGWRFMGTLFGILMLPLIYIFSKRLFKSTFLSSVGILLMAFDFMHFSQTRIATIDSYPVFFILLMYYFMYLFYEKADSLPMRKVLLYLLLSGLSFGLAIASKWIGFYGGAGLAILFFTALYKRIKQKTMKELLILLPCILFFVVIPFIIYYISYIPIHIADGQKNYLQNFWNYQKHMFSYHSDLEADHPFGSPWYTWPFVIRPIWYYGNEALRKSGLTSSIVGMGNPLLWYVSFFAILFVFYMALRQRKKDARPLFLSVSYLSQFVPWMIITRVCFIYHYFASLPFALFGLLFGFEKMLDRFPWARRAICIFTVLCGILFLAFYPVLSGAEVPRNYVLSCLTWFESWILGY